MEHPVQPWDDDARWEAMGSREREVVHHDSNQGGRIHRSGKRHGCRVTVRAREYDPVSRGRVDSGGLK